MMMFLVVQELKYAICSEALKTRRKEVVGKDLRQQCDYNERIITCVKTKYGCLMPKKRCGVCWG